MANATLTAVAMNTLRRPKRSAIQPQKGAGDGAEAGGQQDIVDCP